ncbi:MAG: hypothetical protein BM556_08960 [Bacteriovorax sp. MedPE-SWde]|nr:MAG: hypothetical protein BM556_08960 [Bacteriovorax sp. MedPE-SWde]
MKGIILAAGRGSRMGSLTDNLPKCRTEFLGKELIDWQLLALKEAGINEIAIITGYLKETFEYQVTYFNNNRWSETNMVMTLMEAEEWLSKDECIVSYSDICFSSRPIRKLMKDKSDFAISYDPDWYNLWKVRMDDPLSDAETFKLDTDSNIIEIGQKTDDLNDIRGQFMGLIKVTPTSFKDITKLLEERTQQERDKFDFTSLLNEMIKNNCKVRAVEIDDQWYEVDTEDDLNAYLKWRTPGNIFEKI